MKVVGGFFHAEQHSQVRLVASCSVVTVSLVALLSFDLCSSLSSL